jgi:hypothetical protein
MKIKWLEPLPDRLFCPQDQYQEWLNGGWSGEWLGEWIVSPGGSFRNKVVSGPCCRIFAGNGYNEAHSFERSWEPKNKIAHNADPLGYGSDRRNWTRSYPNYLSYLVLPATGMGASIYMTVRWELPTKEAIAPKSCSLVCPLSTPLEKAA